MATFRIHCLGTLLGLAMGSVAGAQPSAGNATPSGAGTVSHHAGIESPALDGAGACVCADCGCQGSHGPRWTIWADVLFLHRDAARSRTLATAPNGAPLLNVTDHTFDFEAGPRVGLIYHMDCNTGIEIQYFGIDAWQAQTQLTGPLLLPGNNQAVFDNRSEVYASELHSLEVNWRERVNCTTFLAGFRWLQLDEDVAISARGVPVAGVVGIETENSLYGVQGGIERRFSWARFHVDAVGKAGVYYNEGEHNVGINFAAGAVPVLTANSNQRDSATSFVGELGVKGEYQITSGLSIYAGYQLMWIERVALAPNQVYFPNVIAPDVDFDDGVFYHGGFAGVMLRF